MQVCPNRQRASVFTRLRYNEGGRCRRGVENPHTRIGVLGTSLLWITGKVGGLSARFTDGRNTSRPNIASHFREGGAGRQGSGRLNGDITPTLPPPQTSWRVAIFGNSEIGLEGVSISKCAGVRRNASAAINYRRPALLISARDSEAAWRPPPPHCRCGLKCDFGGGH